MLATRSVRGRKVSKRGIVRRKTVSLARRSLTADKFIEWVQQLFEAAQYNVWTYRQIKSRLGELATLCLQVSSYRDDQKLYLACVLTRLSVSIVDPSVDDGQSVICLKEAERQKLIEGLGSILSEIQQAKWPRHQETEQKSARQVT